MEQRAEPIVGALGAVLGKKKGVKATLRSLGTVWTISKLHSLMKLGGPVF